MPKDKINPWNNPRQNLTRKCSNPKCRRPIPPNVTKLNFYKCVCGTVAGCGPDQRGGAR